MDQGFSCRIHRNCIASAQTDSSDRQRRAIGLEELNGHLIALDMQRLFRADFIYQKNTLPRSCRFLSLTSRSCRMEETFPKKHDRFSPLPFLGLGPKKQRLSKPAFLLPSKTIFRLT